jgi:membrane protease YdiL (CAAX protease family)
MILNTAKNRLIAEIILIFTLQIILIILTSIAAESAGFKGIVPAAAGVVFIILPVIILDKTGKPYVRYGLRFTNPLKDILPVLAVALISWSPIVLFIFIFPHVWGVQDVSWNLKIPDNYIQIAATHILVVAIPEEFFYRGYLLGRLDDIFTMRKKIFGTNAGFGLIISSVFFAIGHFAVYADPARLLVFFPSLLFGWLRYRQKNISAPVLYHAGSNIFMDLFRAGFGL